MLLTSIPSASQLGPRNKPVAIARIHPELARRANGVFVFDGSMRDALLGAVTLSFGSGTAAPTWGVRAGGYGLVFDGSSDLASGTLLVAPAALGLWIACSLSFDTVPVAAADAFALTHAIASGGFFRIGSDASGNLRGVVRTATAGTVGTVTGAAIEQGKVYNCVFISRTRTEHVLYINGARFSVATDIGATFTAGLETIAAGALVLNTNTLFFDGCAHWGVYGTKDPGDGFLQALSINPYRFLFAPEPRIWVPVSSNFTLAIANLAHAQTAANLALTQVHALAVANGIHTQSSGNLALTQAHILALSNLLHSQSAGNLTLTQAHALALSNLLHAQSDQQPGADMLKLGAAMDYARLAHVGSLDGVVNDTKGTLSFWIKTTGLGYSGVFMGHGSGSDFACELGAFSDGMPSVILNGVAGGVMFLLCSTALTPGTTYNVLASWDRTTGTSHIRVNDVDDKDVTNSSFSGTSSDPFQYDQEFNWLIGDDNTIFVGDLIWAPGEYLDLDVPANCRKFINGDGTPADVGIDGEKPFGYMPAVYIRVPDSGVDGGTIRNLNRYDLNQGTGEVFYMDDFPDDEDPPIPVDTIFLRAPPGDMVLTQVHMLTLANAIHAQTAANIAVTQAHALAVANALHSQTAGNVALTTTYILALANLLHSQSAGSITLTQAHMLALANETHAQSAGALTLTQAHALILANALHGQSAGNIALTQAHLLVLANGIHGQSAGTLALVQAHVLVLANLLHSQSAGNVTLSAAAELVLADLLHTQSAGSLAFTQVHVLALANALHDQSAANVPLTVTYILALANLLHSQSADNVAIFTTAELVLANLLHSQSAASLALTQAHVLSLTNELHGQSADNLTLTQAHVLALATALHTQSLDSLTLTQAHILALANELHGQSAGNVALSATAELVLANLQHAQTAGNLVLVQVHALVLANLLHGQTAGNIALTQAHALLVSNLLHAQAAAGVVMTQAHAITVSNMVYENLVDSIVLDFSVVLGIGDSLHGHLADSLGLSQGHVIAIANAVHAHLEDNLNLSQAQFIVVSDVLHAQIVNNITFGELIAISPDALLTVEAEDRLLTVGAEDRILVIEASNRLLVVVPQRFTKKVLH